jgi:phosphoglycolate phosphatase-like HAD superfamily hydrolase
MQLVIFDLDGTLTRTTRIDELCYMRALRDEFGVTSIDNDWLQYTQATDSGITVEIFQNHFGRSPSDEEIERVKHRFVALLAQAIEERPESCTQVEGAAAALERLTAHPHWAAALATGSWQASALLKLSAAKLEAAHLPAAFADDSMSRDGIVTLALQRARLRYGQETFSRVVCVGDAPWDVRTARRLQFPLLGVGTGRRAELLRHEGAGEVLPDFSDFDAFLRTLEKVDVPR